MSFYRVITSTAHSAALHAQKHKEHWQRLSMRKNTKSKLQSSKSLMNYWQPFVLISNVLMCSVSLAFEFLIEICELQSGVPPLKKPITAELGCVTPCIVTPGKWSKSAIQYHAEECAASLTVNAGHNCCKLEVIITAKDWPQRQEFMQAVKWALTCHPWTLVYFCVDSCLIASLEQLLSLANGCHGFGMLCLQPYAWIRLSRRSEIVRESTCQQQHFWVFTGKFWMRCHGK